MSEWKKTLCNLCAMTCGLEMEVEDNRIINVRPDPASPSSDCYCCRKGRSAKYFVENSERILYPQKRVGDHYERISWEQAYAEIAEKANAILKAHGPRSAAIIGGGGGATGAAAATAQPFLKAIGSQYFFNPIGVEFMGIFWSCGRIFGDQFHPLEPDDKNCEVLIFWGSNSYVSHQLPNARPMIREFSRVFSPEEMETIAVQTDEIHYLLDLWAACWFYLHQAGLKEENIHFSGLCTYENWQEIFSHRRSGGRRGIMNCLIRIRESQDP